MKLNMGLYQASLKPKKRNSLIKMRSRSPLQSENIFNIHCEQ